MGFQEGFDFRVDRRLQHSPRSFLDDGIQRAARFELLPKRKHFRIHRLIHWNVWSICRSLLHGVSLCPRRAAEVAMYLSRIRRFLCSLQEHNN